MTHQAQIEVQVKFNNNRQTIFMNAFDDVHQEHSACAQVLQAITTRAQQQRVKSSARYQINCRVAHARSRLV